MAMRRATLALLAALGVVLSACGGSGDAATTTTTAAPTTAATAGTTTTTAAPTTTRAPDSTSTTVTLPTGPAGPLNGLPVNDPDLLARRVVAVKVDNHWNARPQSGLQEADAVIEILVEGGITRFIALFHQSDSEYVGPVRSVRPTDSTMLAPLDAPLVFSGGQAWIQEMTISRGIPLIAEGANGLFRMSHRYAPHNLYADTIDIRATADERGIDDDIDGPLYAVGPWAEDPAEAASRIELNWGPGHPAGWTYEDGKYLRYEGDTQQTWVARDGTSGPMAFDVLVFILGRQYVAVPPPGGKSSVPAIDTLGSGRLLIFAHGKVLDGTWERDAVEDPFRLFDQDGNPATVPPGVPWISVYPQQQPFTFE
jgi:hypothetical protein